MYFKIVLKRCSLPGTLVIALRSVEKWSMVGWKLTSVENDDWKWTRYFRAHFSLKMVPTEHFSCSALLRNYLYLYSIPRNASLLGFYFWKSRHLSPRKELTISFTTALPINWKLCGLLKILRTADLRVLFHNRMFDLLGFHRISKSCCLILFFTFITVMICQCHQ